MADNKVVFHKMQGAGNDFVVIDNRDTQYSLVTLRKWCRRLCKRRFGIGADGLLSLESDEHGEADYCMLYLNADGSDAGMCGNGGRCLALFAHHLGLGGELLFRVHDEHYRARIDQNSRVELVFPMSVTPPETRHINGNEIYVLRPGTEHAVMLSGEDTLQDRPHLKEIAQNIRYNEYYFPVGTNVNFIAQTDLNNISGELQTVTYERGVEDFTYACGTGAIASAISAHHYGILCHPGVSHPTRWRIHYIGGELEVSFNWDKISGIYENISLKGPAKFVFKGEITP